MLKRLLRFRKHWALLIAPFGLAAWAILAIQPIETRANDDTPPKYCVEPPHTELCASQPFDQTDFDSSFEYINIIDVAQDPFDIFSWQSFVALNWPAETNGHPMDTVIGTQPDAERVWQHFPNRDQVFPVSRKAETTPCGHVAKHGQLTLTVLEQSDGTVLIDQNRNYVVYDTRLNHVARSYIETNGLHVASAQTAFTQNFMIAFPSGRFAGKNQPASAVHPSTLIKTAWRIMVPDEGSNAYLTRPAVVSIPAARSADNAPHCHSVNVGLVGMHIVVRTHSGNGDKWLWATFEHKDNAPIAANARNVNSIYAENLFPTGCTSPQKTVLKHFSFYDPSCTDCKNNVEPDSDGLWRTAIPFAMNRRGEPGRPSQVVRCWDIFESTARINAFWQKKLEGTVFENYFLVSTQWRGAQRNPLSGEGELPRFLTNTTMETYIQDHSDGTCMGCHATARTLSETAADFTFLLQRAR